ncbi:MAG: hypothetical protein IIB21_05470 [Chloroflexi bacterium]|nr:hypothetical protein [Chloroflexota bacterium]
MPATLECEPWGVGGMGVRVGMGVSVGVGIGSAQVTVAPVSAGAIG